MRSVRRATTFVLLFIVGVAPALLSGCGGGGHHGGGGGGGSNDIIITITNCDSTTYAAYGVFCFDFTATGPAANFDVLTEFIGGPTGPREMAYEVPPGLAMQLNPPLTPPSDVTNLAIQFKGQVISGRFCWFVGADLGFVGAFGIQFKLTPVEVGGTNPLGPEADCPALNYLGGGQTQLLSAQGGALTPGRAGQCGENVSGKNIAIAGGYTSAGSALMSLNTADRFTIDPGNFSYMKNASPLSMQNARTDHACSFFLDDASGAVKMLITGGADYGAGMNSAANATADVYSFAPQSDSIASTMGGGMNVARRGHTATWIPSNKVVIIGGETGGPTGSIQLGSIEIFDPAGETFTLLNSPTLNFPRRGHTATLLPSGKILIAGGFSITSPTTPLQAEIFDPVAMTIMSFTTTVNRIHHTATRLANGWVLLAGGKHVSDGLFSSSADIFEPELGGVGGMGAFTPMLPMMSGMHPRAYHAASLLGDGNALLTGGETANGPVITNTAEIFQYQSMTFTPTISMSGGRAEHSSTPTNCGQIVLIGGRRVVGSATQFLSDLEMYPFDNMNPVVASAFTAASPMQGTMYIDLTVTDQDSDGGYVIIRHRTPGGMFRLCTITEQNPSSAGAVIPAFPNMHVEGLPTQPFPFAFKWSFSADGLSSGQMVEIEIIPVGVTLGTPVTIPVFQIP